MMATPSDPNDAAITKIAALLEKSSLGTPEAKAARARTPLERAQRIAGVATAAVPARTSCSPHHAVAGRPVTLLDEARCHSAAVPTESSTPPREVMPRSYGAVAQDAVVVPILRRKAKSVPVGDGEVIDVVVDLTGHDTVAVGKNLVDNQTAGQWSNASRELPAPPKRGGWNTHLFAAHHRARPGELWAVWETAITSMLTTGTMWWRDTAARCPQGSLAGSSALTVIDSEVLCDGPLSLLAWRRRSDEWYHDVLHQANSAMVNADVAVALFSSWAACRSAGEDIRDDLVRRYVVSPRAPTPDVAPTCYAFDCHQVPVWKVVFSSMVGVDIDLVVVDDPIGDFYTLGVVNVARVLDNDLVCRTSGQHVLDQSTLSDSTPVGSLDVPARRRNSLALTDCRIFMGGSDYRAMQSVQAPQGSHTADRSGAGSAASRALKLFGAVREVIAECVNGAGVKRGYQ